MPRGRYQEFTRLLDGLKLTEDDAVTLASVIGARFNWAGSAFTTEEINKAIDAWLEDDQVPTAMTAVVRTRQQDVIDRVRASRIWIDEIGNKTSEIGYDMIADAVEAAIASLRKR